jgi:hypothetical protein
MGHRGYHVLYCFVIRQGVTLEFSLLLMSPDALTRAPANLMVLLSAQTNIMPVKCTLCGSLIKHVMRNL